MKDTDEVIFFNNVSADSDRKYSIPSMSSLLTLEVRGDATFSLTLLAGCIEDKDGFSTIAGIDLSDMSLKKEITKAGIYQFGVDGLYNLTFKLTGVSGGAISVFGRVGG